MQGDLLVPIGNLITEPQLSGMRVRLIAVTITPVVSKSRFLRVRGVRAIISNQSYLNLEDPTRHQCRTSLVVKQGLHGMPVYRRAQIGYLHVDFKVKTWKQAHRKSAMFFSGVVYGAPDYVGVWPNLLDSGKVVSNREQFTATGALVPGSQEPPSEPHSPGALSGNGRLTARFGRYRSPPLQAGVFPPDS